MGGFLGIGERSVAVAFDEVEIKRADNGDELRVYTDMSRGDLEQMPEYDG